ncbi:hypothetical protein DVH24_020819 [Malus domestica]|uniref:Disease resistance N-terminal domain-containing protein n=1 Tax=Malus domestica TaxID=3750 RepID=A0A498J9H2_MALDO|nr:hypothetical protein DVH24_020819 [Malus domestica]
MDAAASIVLSPALQVLFDRLASPLLQKASDLFGYNDNFQSLQHALVRAQATLEVAEEQQFTNRAARLWLLDLKNARDAVAHWPFTYKVTHQIGPDLGGLQGLCNQYVDFHDFINLPFSIHSHLSLRRVLDNSHPDRHRPTMTAPPSSSCWTVRSRRLTTQYGPTSPISWHS